MAKPIWSEKKGGKWSVISVVIAICFGLWGMHKFATDADLYFASLFDHIFTLLAGCGATVVLGLIQKYVVKKPLSPKWEITILAAFVFFAGFQAWRDEHRILAAEQTKHNPRLEFAFNWINAGTETDDPHSATVIMITGTLTNIGEMPSVVLSWTLDAQFPDGTHVSLTPMLFGSTHNVQSMTSQHNLGIKFNLAQDYLPDIAMRTPVAQGGGMPGFIMFKILSVPASRFAVGGIRYTLCYEDVVHQHPCDWWIAPPGADIPIPPFPGMHRDEGKP
jgi:hypothetical protein